LGPVHIQNIGHHYQSSSPRAPESGIQANFRLHLQEKHVENEIKIWVCSVNKLLFLNILTVLFAV